MNSLCRKCKRVLIDLDEIDDWFIDDGSNMEQRDHKELSHICGECRCKNVKLYWKGETKCIRCYKSGEWGIGKWNDNCGHIQCYICGDLCYKCHGLLHYNK